MWSKPTQAEETFNSIVEKLRWLRQNPELIHPPAGKANVQSMEIVLLDREIGQALLDAEPDADALITKILHREMYALSDFLIMVFVMVSEAVT